MNIEKGVKERVRGGRPGTEGARGDCLKYGGLETYQLRALYGIVHLSKYLH